MIETVVIIKKTKRKINVTTNFQSFEEVDRVNFCKDFSNSMYSAIMIVITTCDTPALICAASPMMCDHL